MMIRMRGSGSGGMIGLLGGSRIPDAQWRMVMIAGGQGVRAARRRPQPVLRIPSHPFLSAGSRTNGYVTRTSPRTANVVKGPIHPLSPPTPISNTHQQSTSSSSTTPTTTATITPTNTVIEETERQHIISLPSPTSSQTQPYHTQRCVLGQTVVEAGQRSLTIHSLESALTPPLTLSYLALRDSCQEPHSVDPRTHQKLFKSSDIPRDIHPIHIELLKNDHRIIGSIDLLIVWSHSLSNHQTETSTFSLDYLRDETDPKQPRHKSQHLKHQLWLENQPQKRVMNSTNEIRRLQESNQLFIDYQELEDARRRGKTEFIELILEQRLNKLGLVFFQNVGNQEFELERMMNSLGLDLRRTFYGDLWDVKSEGEDAKNVANTTLQLDLHMDLLHFQNPPRFQFLHCLKNQVKGGSSAFVDSYSIISRLLSSKPELFKTLTQKMIRFEYINNSHHTTYEHPTIELKPTIEVEKVMNDPSRLLESIVAVNYSPPFQSGFLSNFNQSNDEDVFEGFREIEKISKEEEMRFEIRLKEGEIVGFDNRRILHSRTAFESDSRLQKGQVNRWLKGAYVDGDSVWDRIRIINST